MEAIVQIKYNGYRADYKITSFDSTFYHAELTKFYGLQPENAPAEIYFAKINNQAIASSDVIKAARDLIMQLDKEYPITSLETL